MPSSGVWLSFVSSSLLGHFPIWRLFDPYEAPGPLVDRLGQVVQMVGGHANVLHRVLDVLLVGPNHHLQVVDQAACVSKRLLQLDEVRLRSITQGRNGSIRVRNGSVHVVHGRPQLRRYLVGIFGESLNVGSNLVDSRLSLRNDGIGVSEKGGDVLPIRLTR